MNLDLANPLKNILLIVKGFNSVRKLSEEEKFVIYPLIKVRLAYLSLRCYERLAQAKDDEYVKKCKEDIVRYLKIIANACTNSEFFEKIREI